MIILLNIINFLILIIIGLFMVKLRFQIFMAVVIVVCRKCQSIISCLLNFKIIILLSLIFLDAFSF